MGGRRRCGEQRRAVPVARSRTDAAPRRLAHGMISPLLPPTLSTPRILPSHYPYHPLHRCGVTSSKRTCSASASLPASSRRGSSGGELPICPSHWSGCTPPRRCRSERLERRRLADARARAYCICVCLRGFFLNKVKNLNISAHPVISYLCTFYRAHNALSLRKPFPYPRVHPPTHRPSPPRRPASYHRWRARARSVCLVFNIQYY